MATRLIAALMSFYVPKEIELFRTAIKAMK